MKRQNPEKSHTDPVQCSRVLLVEDDPSVARFVSLALEDSPVDLIICPDVPAALAALAQAPCALIITDLMLPGESGVGLLGRLRDAPDLRGGAVVVVFSAGLNKAKLAELSGYPVWRVLSKPASVTALVQCVDDALASVDRAEPMPLRPRAVTGYEEAIRTYFSGDEALFHAYLKTCLEQFVADIASGDASASVHDLAELGRLAHSLKTVLRTLGRPDAGGLAAELERQAATGDLAGALSSWQSLRGLLL